MELVSLMGYVVIGTIVVLILSFYYYMKVRDGKVRIYLRGKGGHDRFYFIKPDAEGLIWLNKEAYKYASSAVRHTRSGILRQLTPTLDFMEGFDAALTIDRNSLKAVNSSAELALLANNHVAYDFDKAAAEKFGLKQLAMYMIMAAIIIGGGVLGGGYYIVTKLGGAS